MTAFGIRRTAVAVVATAVPGQVEVTASVPAGEAGSVGMGVRNSRDAAPTVQGPPRSCSRDRGKQPRRPPSSSQGPSRVSALHSTEHFISETQPAISRACCWHVATRGPHRPGQCSMA